MIFQFGKYRVNIDIEKTIEFYEKAVEDLPKEVLNFFSKIGIDSKKIAEVYVETGRVPGIQ